MQARAELSVTEAAGLARRRFVFVAGCGHTGTTLMAALLGSHSEIYTITDETEVFGRSRQLESAVQELARIVAGSASTAPIICEKTPRHVYHVERMLAAFPDARVVLMLRDGRDAVASLKRRSGDVACSISRWEADTRETLRWRGHERVMLVRYEDLVTQPEATLGAVCAFVGLRYEPAMLRFHEDPRHWFGQTELQPADGVGEESHRVRRNWQVHQPLFDGRGVWHTALTPADLTLFDRAAAGLMHELGYYPDAWPRPAGRRPAEPEPAGKPSVGGLAAFAKVHLAGPELAMMRRVLARGYRTYLEFGTGGTTLLALQAGLPTVISVDADPERVLLAREHPELREAIAAGRAKVMHADIGPVAAWGNPVDETSRPKWPAYVERAWKCCARHGYRPDLVFVDGRFRVACCFAAALAAEQVDVLIHDISPERPHYNRVFDYFDTVESELSLYLLRLKPEADRLQLVAQLLRHLFDFR